MTVRDAPVSPAPYLLAWLLLLALLGATMGANALGLGLSAALAVAVLKAGLILAVFMHLRWGHPATRLAAAVGGLLLLAFLWIAVDDARRRPPARSGVGSAPRAGAGGR